MALVGALVAPYVGIINFCEALQSAFDLDVAVGVQLDIIGLWVGVGRKIAVPVTGPSFSWNVSGAGWGQANWGNSSGSSTIYILSDEDYRFLLRGRIAANHWNGTYGTLANVYAQCFADLAGVSAWVTDGLNMSVTVTVTGTLSNVQQALLTGNYIGLLITGIPIHYVF
jgi:hypothetical protein